MKKMTNFQSNLTLQEPDRSTKTGARTSRGYCVGVMEFTLIADMLKLP